MRLKTHHSKTSHFPFQITSCTLHTLIMKWWSLVISFSFNRTLIFVENDTCGALLKCGKQSAFTLKEPVISIQNTQIYLDNIADILDSIISFAIWYNVQESSCLASLPTDISENLDIIQRQLPNIKRLQYIKYVLFFLWLAVIKSKDIWIHQEMVNMKKQERLYIHILIHIMTYLTCIFMNFALLRDYLGDISNTHC